MATIFAKQARLPDQWASHVRVRFDHGHISQITLNGTAQQGDKVVDTLLPALSNLHSHSFQRAMAGMTEIRASAKDSFWTWRARMYQFLQVLTPEDIQAIAAQTFVEMQEAGFAAVGEFHYVHHQTGGTPYATLTELSDRIFAAAQETGIGLTHLPVLYSYGGAGRAPLTDGQLRFGNDVDRFMRLVEACRAQDVPADTRIGIAPHSLRATCPEDLETVLQIAGDAPVHIHIAEQPKEVADVQSWLGARPVEWLMTTQPVTANWCLIHATHMTAAETQSLAASGAVAGLCPVTEANLGDGPFNGVAFAEAKGRFGVGSDSNVRISMVEELRSLEYSQRLRDLGRARMISGDGHIGAYLYQQAARGGAQALARRAGRIEEGALADLVAIDSTHPTLCALEHDSLLDGLVFAAPDKTVTDLWSAGRHMVQDGAHVARARIAQAFQSTMQGIKDRL